jgi:predicted PurR-regulated permease PerM
VGQTVSTIINALVAFFLAEGNYLGLDPFPYMLLVVGLAFFHDQVYDSLVIPRLIGSVLGVHPALVLIVALVLTSWIGVLGLLLAAPILASFQLITTYIIRKMMDQAPWPDTETVPPTLGEQVRGILQRVSQWFSKTSASLNSFYKKMIARFKNNE